MADQAEADMRIARAKAEETRANAVAREQEMRALTKENQAAVVMAESEIPKSMASAYREGQLRDTTARQPDPSAPAAPILPVKRVLGPRGAVLGEGRRHRVKGRHAGCRCSQRPKAKPPSGRHKDNRLCRLRRPLRL